MSPTNHQFQRRALRVTLLLVVLAISWIAVATAQAASAPGVTLEAPPTTAPPTQRLEVAVSATEQAVRLTPPQTTTTTAPPAPTTTAAPVGLWGQPFAPADWTGCLEMEFYRKQWGLPAAFDAIGWRESNCRNEDVVKTFCCHGYWQMYTSLHVRDHRLAPKMEACGVSSHHDLNSDIPIEKQRQACAAKALYDVMGTSPWSATR